MPVTRPDPTLFVSRGKLCSLPARLSFCHHRSAEKRMWADAELGHRRCRLGHRHFHPHVAGERQPRVRRRTECSKCVKPGRNICAAYPNFTSVEGPPKQRLWRITASTWSPPPRRHIGLIARRRGASSFAFSSPVDGPCCCGTSGALIRRRFSVNLSSCCSSYGTDYQSVRHERTTEEIETFFAPSPFQVQTFEYLQQFDYPALEGRLLSSSYTPQADDVAYRPMVQRIAADIRCPSGKMDAWHSSTTRWSISGSWLDFWQRCGLSEPSPDQDTIRLLRNQGTNQRSGTPSAVTLTGVLRLR